MPKLSDCLKIRLDKPTQAKKLDEPEPRAWDVQFLDEIIAKAVSDGALPLSDPNCKWLKDLPHG